MSAAGASIGKARATALAAAIAIERAFALLCGMLLAALFASVIAAAAARYLAGASIFGADEAALWLFASLVFLGLPLVSTSVLAMRLDLFASFLGAHGRLLLTVIADAVVAHTALVLLFGGTAVMAAIGGVSPTLGLPEGWRFGPVAIGAGATLLLMLLRGAGEGRFLSALAALALGLALYGLAANFFMPVPRPSLAAAGFAFAVVMLGAPLPHALLSGASLAIAFGAPLPEAAIVQTTVSSLGRFLLLAIPFFLLAGTLMIAGGLAERMIALARSLVGHWQGGMAQTVLGTNLLFSGLSGSSIADAAFGAKVLAPALVKSGYAPPRAAAIVAATAILPNIVPPSIAFLILAVATNLSVGRLFAGGLVAGLVLVAVLAVTLRLLSRGVPGLPRARPGERAASFRQALPVLGLAAVIVGGIRFGIVTTTEAAALAALYALVVCLLARESSGWRAIGAAFAQSAREAASVGLLVATAAPFVFLLSVDDLPGLVSRLFEGLANPFSVLLLANLILLLAGAFLDIGAAILLVAPLLVPVAAAAGIDPVHFGVVLVVNLMIGGLTPPVGILVYVSARLSGVSPAAVFASVLPLVAALLLALALLSLAVGLLAVA